MKRPVAGRALFYHRDSGGKHETTPDQYVAWALSKSAELHLSFDGIPDSITAMIRDGRSTNGDPPREGRFFHGRPRALRVSSLVGSRGWEVRATASGSRICPDSRLSCRLAAGPRKELRLIQRILTMLETMPATRVAAELTTEGIPSPNAGRCRKDNGVTHPVSGVWRRQRSSISRGIRC